jgi:hypothetical protein
MAAEKFAIKALNAIANNKAIIVIPQWYKIFWWLDRFSPSLGIRITQRFMRDSEKRFGITLER